MRAIAPIAWPAVTRPSDLALIVEWSAAQLSSAIRTRVVSCVEVMHSYLDHIDVVNPQVNAIVALRSRPDLVAEAVEKDRLLDAGIVEGWMHGFPQAVKDLADIAGWTTSYGFFDPETEPAPAPEDSVFVARLRAAGAIFIGRTNTPEFGLGSHTVNSIYGTTLNAYDQTRSAGGSSGGAAVAVALRMLPVADGSDFMGSLRNPPGWNNVLGLRPSFGRVPSAGGDLFTAQGGVEGPIARTAQDLALMLSTMSGYDPRAPLSLDQDAGPLAVIQRPDIAGRSIAWLGDLGGYLPMEPEVLSVTRAAVQQLAALGATVVERELPTHGTFTGVGDLWPAWLAYRHPSVAASSAGIYADSALRARLKPEAIWEVEGAIGTAASPPMTAMQLMHGSRQRSDLYEAMRLLFEEVDYVVLPTAQLFPFDAGSRWPAIIDGRALDSYHRWMEVSTLGTLINAPVLALPAGFSREGLPIGLQVIGRNHDERSLLELAAAWERAYPIVETHPPALLTAARRARSRTPPPKPTVNCPLLWPEKPNKPQNWAAHRGR